MPWTQVGLGLALLAAGAIWQIYSDWRLHGLTYLRYTAAAAYIAGSALLTRIAFDHAHPLLALWVGLPGLVAALAAAAKIRDRGRARQWWR